MPFVSQFVEEGRGLLFTAIGRLTGAEILDSKRRLLLDLNRRPPATWALIALEAVESAEISREDIYAITRMDLEIARWAPNIIVAVVAPRDHDFGMARMWETIAESTGWPRGVFRARAEAEAWIREMLRERQPS